MAKQQIPDTDVKSVADILGILRRRKWNVVVPAFSVFALAALLALFFPRTYRSTTTILIEEKEIPREYVATNITSFADQRLQTINQRIMSTKNLIDVMNRFHLYEGRKDRETVDEIVEKMRKKDIKFATIRADVIDSRSGRPAQATIAFSISYEGKSPETVQQVAAELASLYPEENLQARERSLAGDPATEPLAERFSIVEPARLPKTPSSPDIPAILLFGLLSGVGVGAWWAFRKERADNTVRGNEQLVFALPFPSAGGFPGKTARRDAFRRRLRRGFLAASMIACVALALVLARIFATGLDVLWVNLARRNAF